MFGKLAKRFYFRIIQGLSRDEKILDAPTFVLFCSTFPKPELLVSDVPIRIVLSFCACFQNLKSRAQSGVQHALDTRRCFNPFES